MTSVPIYPEDISFKTIRYGKTINLGNYENERVDVEADVRDGQNPSDVYRVLKQWVIMQTVKTDF